jgi:hypothetical protein
MRGEHEEARRLKVGVAGSELVGLILKGLHSPFAQV